MTTNTQHLHNHEAWYTCHGCFKEYDLRSYTRCPYCGLIYHPKNK
jgi:rRNA maturation endonuclease Nob1